MKIGILSMQRVYNYGSFMQSYALKRTIEELGHECVFLDIIPGRQIVKSELVAERKKGIKKYLSKLDIHIVGRIKHVLRGRKSDAIFRRVLRDELGIDAYNPEEQCDAVVIGSDEVFNCTQPKTNYGFSPQLFGQGLNTKKVISYAASFGYTTIESLKKYNILDEVAGYLKTFAALSVRDQNSAEIVMRITGIDPYENVDPVIIGKFDDKIVEPLDDNYIAIYAYANRICDPFEIQSIKQFAKEKGLKTIAVGMYQVWCDKNVYGTPFEMVGYIKKAKYVVTDTFHGCVFSIKYQKNFAAFVRSSNFNKLTDLLRRFNLEKRIVEKPAFLSGILETEVDANAIQRIIEKEREGSLDYLTEELK